jgi:hypothetical protein
MGCIHVRIAYILTRQLAGNGEEHAQIRSSLRPAPGFAPFRYVPIAVLVALSSNPLR